MNILVTAAGGNLGATMAANLAEKHQVVGGVRNPANVNPVSGVSYVELDYDNTATYQAALKSADAVVLQAPPLDVGAYERLIPFIDAINGAGIKRVVFISAYGVDHNDAAPLRKIELKLINDGFNYTILRPNFFMENFTSGFAVGPLEHDGIVLSSAGEGAIAFVSIDDIAEVVAKVLDGADHENQAYTLTGPEALSHDDVARIISSKLGKEVPHVALSGAELKQGAMANGLPESCADYLIMLYDLAEQGLMSAETGDVEQLLGRKPLSFNDVMST